MSLSEACYECKNQHHLKTFASLSTPQGRVPLTQPQMRLLQEKHLHNMSDEDSWTREFQSQSEKMHVPPVQNSYSIITEGEWFFAHSPHNEECL